MFRTKPGEGRALIEDWINRPALRELVEAFGGTWPEGDLVHVVEELLKFSEVWDYRSGRSRLMFHDQDEHDPHEELTYRAAAELGLMNPVPPSQDEYDYLLILGGLATGVEPRVKYAAELLGQGMKIRRQIAGLGSYRELHERELEVSRRYAPHGQYEIDHLESMLAILLRTDFDGGPANAITPDAPQVSYLVEDESIASYAAGNDRTTGRPANTAETYEFFIQSNSIEPGESMVLITSPIYVPYQHLDAVRVLGSHGLEVETVGLITQTQRAHPPLAYRQELRSMIRSSSIELSVAAGR